ncbi:MAG: hypothetical protein ACLUTH_06510 [Blautia massiliensis (ex Durand et al. 2017)]
MTKAATCTAAGTKTYTCTRCKKTRTETIAATGHKAVKDAAVAATCETAGKTEGSHCSVCGTVIKAQTTTAALRSQLGQRKSNKSSDLHHSWNKDLHLYPLQENTHRNDRSNRSQSSERRSSSSHL